MEVLQVMTLGWPAGFLKQTLDIPTSVKHSTVLILNLDNIALITLIKWNTRPPTIG